jgi:hypothetical protein
MSSSYLDVRTLSKTSWPPVARKQRPRTSIVAPQDPLLTTPEAGLILKASVEALKKWRQRGVGPIFIKYESGAVRYRLSVLLQYVNDSTVRR